MGRGPQPLRRRPGMGPRPGRRSRQRRPADGAGAPAAEEEAGDGAPAGAAEPPETRYGRVSSDQPFGRTAGVRQASIPPPTFPADLHQGPLAPLLPLPPVSARSDPLRVDVGLPDLPAGLLAPED